jgi:hypothetical protein
MTDDLRQSSIDLVEALTAGDLEAAARALQSRSEAIARGDQPTAESMALGEHAAALLQDLKRRSSLEATQLSFFQHFTDNR